VGSRVHFDDLATNKFGQPDLDLDGVTSCFHFKAMGGRGLAAIEGRRQSSGSKLERRREK
jgi:hypothetical protein